MRTIVCYLSCSFLSLFFNSQYSLRNMIACSDLAIEPFIFYQNHVHTQCIPSDTCSKLLLLYGGSFLWFHWKNEYYRRLKALLSSLSRHQAPRSGWRQVQENPSNKAVHFVDLLLSLQLLQGPLFRQCWSIIFT